MQEHFDAEVFDATPRPPSPLPDLADEESPDSDRPRAPGYPIWRGHLISAARAFIRRSHLHRDRGEWIE